jgi:acyl-CoA thioester hydrolase
VYTKTLFASWGDMDFNSHMCNTAFLDKAADVRMMFFADNGLPMDEFVRLGFGPVAMKDEIEYLREVRLLEPFEVTLALAGCSEDGSRFALGNEFRLSDGRLAARVTSQGGRLDLAHRKLIAPPDSLLESMRRLDRTEDFTVLPSSVRAAKS